MSILDDSTQLFELTLARLKPTEPIKSDNRRAARRVRVFESRPQTNETCFVPNIPQILHEADSKENIISPRLNQRAFKEELRASEERLNKVKRGCSLFSLINQPPKIHPLEKPKYRFSGVGDKIRELNKDYNGSPQKKLEFIIPVTSKSPERIDLVSKINTSEIERRKLQRIISDSDQLVYRYHNDTISNINHMNSRRFRAMKQFYEDSARNGFTSARKRAERASQKSRLRVLTDFDWWEDIIEFAYQWGPLDKAEQRFMEKISRIDMLTSSVFVSLLNEAKSGLKSPERCIKVLERINEVCHIIDPNLIFMFQKTKSARKHNKLY